MDDPYPCNEIDGKKKFCTAYYHDSWVVRNSLDVGDPADTDLIIVSW